eukprot:SAG22_NODE_1760_length_3634_cov_1.814144_3_plen_71_part_00
MDTDGGVHIHTGTSCEDACGHFYSGSIEIDPWTRSVYGAACRGGECDRDTPTMESDMVVTGETVRQRPCV